MKRGDTQWFPKSSSPVDAQGWYEEPIDQDFVRYWDGGQWARISSQKAMIWWMRLVSAVLWWGSLCVVVFTLGRGLVTVILVVVAVLLLVAWIAGLSWITSIPARTVLGQSLRSCISAGW